MRKNISVIVPVYNCAPYIRRCVESILFQTYYVYEIILIDDGSTDDSGKICDEISEKEKKIKVVHQINQGVSQARNIGIHISSGEYLAFVDADDELPPYAFEYLLSTTETADLYIGSCLILGKEPDFMFALQKEYSNKELAYAMMCEPKTKLLMSGVWGKLFLSHIIKLHQIMFDVEWQNGEDGLFIVKYLTYVNKIVNRISFPPVYYLYRYCADERISAVSAFYPDFFEFYLVHSENLYKIIDETDKKPYHFFHKFMNELIIHLVRAYAYYDFFDEILLIEKLKDIVQRKLVCQAIRTYRRDCRSYSIMIPLAIYLKNIPMLVKALRYRAKQYLKDKNKCTLLKSVYREKDSRREDK